MQDDIKLLPCPFCGHDTPEFERMGTPRQSCIVICGNCGCRHESSDEGAACGTSWNERAILADREGRQSADAHFDLWQDEMIVASASGPRAQALAEIQHYAAVYSQDGPVQIEEVIRIPVDPAADTQRAQRGKENDHVS